LSPEKQLMVEPKRLKNGKDFEKIVFNDFFNHSKDGDVKSNETIYLKSLNSTRVKRGRPDILITELSDFVTIFEIKATNWDLIKRSNIKKNLWRHQRQLFKYVDKFMEEDEINVCLGIIYPHPPMDNDLRDTIETYLEGYGTPAYWFNEIRSSTDEVVGSGRES